MQTFLLSVVLLFGAPSPVPIITPDACYRNLVARVERIMREEAEGLLTAEQRQVLVRLAMEDFANCRAPQGKLPYTERRGQD